ncbi:MAG: hypothetical protein EAZ36_05475, partial [Verrucomicrobia bacterium]
MEKNKLALKLSALAGVAVSATSSTQAAVVLSPTIGSGIKPPSSAGSFDWDVDGDSVIDFRLFNGNPPYSSSSGGGGNEANFDDANGGRLVGAVGSSSSFSTSGVRHDGIQKLGAGFVVGAVMPGYGFKNGPQASVTITNNGATGGDAVDQGWNIGDTGYFGFKF